MPSRLNWIFLTTNNALKRIAVKRPKSRILFITNPTTGALEVAPEHRDEVCRALCRSARQISSRLVFRARLTQLRLYPLIVFLRLKLAVLRFLNKPLGKSSQGVMDRHNV